MKHKIVCIVILALVVVLCLGACDINATCKHQMTAHPTTAATCTEKGNSEYWQCEKCNKLFADEKGKTEILPESTVIAAKGHDWGGWAVVTSATCTSEGSEVRSCYACNEFETRTTEKLPHTEVVVPAVAPTCTESGLTEGKKCSVCDTIFVEQQQIAAKGHVEFILPAVEPTFTETGLTEGKKCSVCGVILVEPQQIPMLEPIPIFEVPSVGYDGSEVNITFYHSMGWNLSTVLDKYIAKFNEMYPNIHISHTQIGGYDDVKNQISTELDYGKTDANIAYCYPDHVALYNTVGAVTKLDNLIASTIEVTRADGTKEILGLTEDQIADFISAFYNECKAFGDGLMYSLPLSKFTEVLYYNKTFFEENNLTVPKTWDEMEALCERIKQIDPDCIPLGYDSESNWFITMCEQMGSPYTSATGEHFLFDNETNRNFVKKFSEWYDKGYVTTQTLYGAYISGLFVNPDPYSQRCYMSIGSSSGATYQRPEQNWDGTYLFDVGITSIPQVDPANPKVVSQGPSVCIFQKENPQEVVASWLFVKYLTTSVDFQAEFSIASGCAPVLKSVADSPLYKAFIESADGGANIVALCAKTCLEQQEAYFVSPAFKGSSVARDEVGALLTKCLMLNTSNANIDSQIKQAFEDAVDECKYQIGMIY